MNHVRTQYANLTERELLAVADNANSQDPLTIELTQRLANRHFPPNLSQQPHPNVFTSSQSPIRRKHNK